MIGILALLQGCLISLMVWFNSGLSGRIGYLPALVVFNMIAFLLVFAYHLIRRKKIRMKGFPLPLFLGGMFGTVVVLLQTWSINLLGVSLTFAVTLTGQLIMSILVDSRGLFGRPKQRLSPSLLLPAGLMTVGLFLLAV